MVRYNIKKENGQSLIEAMIGMTIGGILIGASVATISFFLRNNLDTKMVQIADPLASEYLDNVKSLAESNWQMVYSPIAAKGEGSQFYLVTSSTGYLIEAGATSTIIEGKTFTRFFSIEDVNRDSCGIDNITTEAVTACPYGSGSEGIASDPSTQKITVKVDWLGGRSLSKVQYLTRNQNNIFAQGNWLGGAGQENFASGTNNKFSTSTGNIDFVSATGSLRLILPQ